MQSRAPFAKRRLARRPVCGALLDVDGTLIDSNAAHAEAWVDAFQEYGLSASIDIVRRLIGVGGDKLLPAATGIDADGNLGRSVARRRGELFRLRHLPWLRPFRGARRLLERLRAERLRLVVVSSATAEDLDELLVAAGVDDLIDLRTSGDDAGRSKPDADLVQVALRHARLRPEDAVLIGDTPYDVEAAARAGVPAIGLRCGGWSEDGLRGAVATYDDPADVLDHLDHPPLAGWLTASPAARLAACAPS